VLTVEGAIYVLELWNGKFFNDSCVRARTIWNNDAENIRRQHEIFSRPGTPDYH
jgi:hypothetical protein